MEEEEDWDAEPKSSPTKTIAPAASTASEPSNPSTYETLKITDGFKYSYEALASPANIDDWVDPPSYGGGGSRRPNGFRENNFKDSSKPFRNNRFDGPKRNGPRNFDGDKPSRFSNRPVGDWDAPADDIFSASSRPPPAEDWDAPLDTANSMNGAWKPPHVGTPNIGTPHIGTPHMGTPHMGTPHMGTPHIGTPHIGTPHIGTPHMGTPHIGTPVAPTAVDDDEDWDAPAGGSVHTTPRPSNVTPIPMFSAQSSSSPAVFDSKPTHAGSMNVTSNDDDWDDDPPNRRKAFTPQPNRSASRNDDNWDDGPPPDRRSSFSNKPSRSASRNEDNWNDDRPAFNSKPARSSSAVLNDEENWDDDPPDRPPAGEIPIFNPNLSSNMSVKSMEMSSPRPSSVMNTPAPNDDEDWDDDAPPKKAESQIPIFNPNASSGSGHNSPAFGDDPGERGFGGSSRHSDRGFGNEERGFGGGKERGFGRNKDRGFGGSEERGFGGGEQRGFGGGDERGFGRDSYSRNSRGNDRYSNFERRGGRGGRDDRGGRGGRGRRDDRGRGGRGGRGGRDGFNSRDSSRSRDRSFNRRDSYDSRESFGKPFGRQNDDNSFRSPQTSFNTPGQPQEDWDAPNTSASSSSLPMLPIAPSTPASKSVADEESWD